ncbi:MULTISPECIES: DUF2243 domain-containing protein [Cyanophyceae]|uniref:DUF2243 domain-containing protein n=1 Tax=Cyanophyceae TaxID=3028117 RepID=UPI0016838FCD|nr:DUF2243 domain-containing protein [Trichocoleus sp. FACHB-69]MBD1934152.1 DUF2243 domain-containing protein [Trichocoleus sp. FACHB-69]
METKQNQHRLLIIAGILLGMGFAGFFDGIMLHQILQWHHMLTSVQPTTNIGSFEVNTFWDGLFNASTYAMTIAGLVLVWRAGLRGDFVGKSKTFGGALLVGAGAFNVIEGIINHHILGIHHVKSGPNELAWDIGFLILGALLAVVGGILWRDGGREIAPTEIKS